MAAPQLLRAASSSSGVGSTRALPVITQDTYEPLLPSSAAHHRFTHLPRAVQLERLEKAFNSLYCPTAATNLVGDPRSMGVLARHPPTELVSHGVPPGPSGGYFDRASRPDFMTVVPGAEWRKIAVGHKFGPTWSTHWVRVRLDVPGTWRNKAGSGAPLPGASSGVAAPPPHRHPVRV